MNLPTPEEALSGMAQVGSPRVPMGNSAIPSPSAVPPVRGTLVPKKGAQAGDPTPPKANRQNVLAAPEKAGAAYRVSVSVPPMIDPAAGATQANGKIVPSSVGRPESFGDGINGAYAGY